MGSLLELLSVQQALNVARNSVCRHDERVVQRVDIFAGDRAIGMAEEGGDRDLAQTEVIGDAGEAVSKDMGGDALQVCRCEEFFPLPGEICKRRLCPTFLVFTRSEISRLTEIVREFRDGDYVGVSQGLWGRHPTERAAALAG